MQWKGKRHLNGAEKTKGSKGAKVCAGNKPSVCKEKGRDADFALRKKSICKKERIVGFVVVFCKN